MVKQWLTEWLGVERLWTQFGYVKNDTTDLYRHVVAIRKGLREAEDRIAAMEARWDKPPVLTVNVNDTESDATWAEEVLAGTASQVPDLIRGGRFNNADEWATRAADEGWSDQGHYGNAPPPYTTLERVKDALDRLDALQSSPHQSTQYDRGFNDALAHAVGELKGALKDD